MKKRFLIIGDSAAAVGAIRTLRKLDSDAEIICFSDEKEQPYNKCLLDEYLAGELTEEQVQTLTHEQRQKLYVDMRLGERVVGIESDNKTIMLESGQVESYDELLIATGTRPCIPPIEGIDAYEGVFALHSLHDTNAVKDFVAKHALRNAVVIGSGLTGLESASSLRSLGLDVTVVERDGQILARQAGQQAAAFIEQAMGDAGITLQKEKVIVRVMGKDGRVTGIAFDDGSALDVDIVIVATGSKQNTELAVDADIKVSKQGIVVNEHLQTSQEHIYAAGDVIATVDQLTGQTIASTTWPDAVQQGMFAAKAMAGQPKPYQGVILATPSHFFGYKFFSMGIVHPDASYQVIYRSNGYHHTYIIKDNQLQGFILVGNTDQATSLRRALLTKQQIDELLSL